jgi:transposase
MYYIPKKKRNLYQHHLESMASQNHIRAPCSPDWPSITSSSSSRSPTPTPLPPTLPRPPVRQRRQQNTTRDQRIQASTLHKIGWSYRNIGRHIGLSKRQAEYAVKHSLTPRKPTGRPSVVTAETLERIIEWVCASAVNRRTRWDQIPQKLHLDIGYYAIRRALRNHGFAR